jgi:hypothetical protein
MKPISLSPEAKIDQAPAIKQINFSCFMTGMHKTDMHMSKAFFPAWCAQSGWRYIFSQLLDTIQHLFK